MHSRRAIVIFREPLLPVLTAHGGPLPFCLTERKLECDWRNSLVQLVATFYLPDCIFIVNIVIPLKQTFKLLSISIPISFAWFRCSANLLIPNQRFYKLYRSSRTLAVSVAVAEPYFPLQAQWLALAKSALQRFVSIKHVTIVLTQSRNWGS